MSKVKEYTAIANAMSEETKELFENGADAILDVLNMNGVCFPSAVDVITLAELGTLLKVLPMFADKDSLNAIRGEDD